MTFNKLWYLIIPIIVFQVNCENPNRPPDCTIIFPEEDSEYEVGNIIDITIQAEDSDGVIESITIFIQNQKYAVLTEEPYNFSWDTSNEIPYFGEAYIKAVAIDNEGAETSDYVTIILNKVAPTFSDIIISDH